MRRAKEADERKKQEAARAVAQAEADELSRKMTKRGSLRRKRNGSRMDRRGRNKRRTENLNSSKRKIIIFPTVQTGK